MDRPSLTRRTLVAAGAMSVAASTGVLGQAGPPKPDAAKPGGPTTGPTMQAGLSPRLTMHAIDNFHGTPGAGMVCDLSIREGDAYRLLKSVTTAANGRSPEPLLVDDALEAGRYELLLHVDDYFRRLGAALPSPSFLGIVPVRFVIRDVGERHHLPILFSPWGYSYYRGS